VGEYGAVCEGDERVMKVISRVMMKEHSQGLNHPRDSVYVYACGDAQRV
jgi:hypothetical protein